MEKAGARRGRGSRSPVWCLHCGAKRANRPRGLCWTCYYTPGVRDRHTHIGQNGRRGVMAANAEPPPPAEPTAAHPGTADRVAVLEARAAAGLGLWHPDDARADLR